MALSEERREKRWEDMLRDPDEAVRMRALTEIGRAYDLLRGPPSPLGDITLGEAITQKRLPVVLRDSILEQFSSDDPRVRAEAALALIHWRDEDTLEALKRALNDPDVGVRLAAIQAVVETAPEELVEELVGVAEQDHAEIVRAKAVDAIKWLIQKRGPAMKGAVRTTDGHPRTLAQVLEEIRHSDESSYVRFVAGAWTERSGPQMPDS